jgi:hypothetical protein
LQQYIPRILLAMVYAHGNWFYDILADLFGKAFNFILIFLLYFQWRPVYASSEDQFADQPYRRQRELDLHRHGIYGS